MATLNAEGETRNGRLQLFLSSILASLGGVFGQNNQQERKEEEEKEEELGMASIATTVEDRNRIPRG